jgi:GT2 family glycosyltransferase
MSSPTVSIIIVNWNTRELLRGCLVALAKQTATLSPEIIVVDNGSEDGSPEMVAEAFPAVRLIRNTDNVGFVRANNQGLRAATGDLLWMLNSDTEVQESCLQLLVEVMAADTSIGAVAPQLLNPDWSYQFSAGRFAQPGLRVLPATFEDRYNRENDERLMSATSLLPVDWLVGAALLTRREVLDQIGPLDERYYMWLDDMDWCRKLASTGLSRLYVPDARVVHYGRQSAAKLQSEQFVSQLLDSEYLYYRLHHGRPATWAVFLARTLKEAGHSLLARSAEGRKLARLKVALHLRNLTRYCLAPLPPPVPWRKA